MYFPDPDGVGGLGWLGYTWQENIDYYRIFKHKKYFTLSFIIEFTLIAIPIRLTGISDGVNKKLQ